MKAAKPNRAAELQSLGYISFRAGNYARARQHFERAVSLLHAQTDELPLLVALSDLGAACSALGDHAASRVAHEAALAGRRRYLGDTHPDVAVSLHNLAAMHRAQGDLAAAESHHMQAVSIWRAALGETHPFVARGLTSLAALARDIGDSKAAVDYAKQALCIRRQAFAPDDPLVAASLDDLGTAQAQAGDHAAAQQCWSEALAILQMCGGASASHIAPLLAKLGVARRRQRDLDGSAAYFAAALQADPALISARHNLATTLTRLGRHAEARPHREQALRRQSVFVQQASPANKSVLILSISDDGNVPLEHLLPEGAYTRVWWFIEHAVETCELPPYDIVFNGIGDPDMSGAADTKVADFLARCTKPLLNNPAQIHRTRRDRLPILLDGIDGLLVPHVCRGAALATADELMHMAAEAAVTLPALLRPAGSHGGAGILRIDDWSMLDVQQLPVSAWYLTQFADVRSADGFYRKYRVVFVDRKPLPYHLAISPNWLVHYVTANMGAHPWKCTEEAAFLADPRGAIGSRAYAAIEAAGQRLDLDYCGIDFAVRSDGSVVVFEANATMLIHPEAETGTLAFKNSAVQRIVEAMRAAVVSKAERNEADPPNSS